MIVCIYRNSHLFIGYVTTQKKKKKKKKKKKRRKKNSVPGKLASFTATAEFHGPHAKRQPHLAQPSARDSQNR